MPVLPNELTRDELLLVFAGVIVNSPFSRGIVGDNVVLDVERPF